MIEHLDLSRQLIPVKILSLQCTTNTYIANFVGVDLDGAVSQLISFLKNQVLLNLTPDRAVYIIPSIIIDEIFEYFKTMKQGTLLHMLS